jgi:hypothetical protein
MRRKKFFEKHFEAKTFMINFFGHDEQVGLYDLKKIYPRRVKTRFFVGTYLEWLNI